MSMTKQRGAALFAVKLTHTPIFLVQSAAILYILYSAVFDMRSVWLWVAVMMVLLEMVVYLGNGARCPLTKLAAQMGDETGNDFIADIFLPRWAARLIPPVCGTLAVIGMVIIGVRWLLAAF